MIDTNGNHITQEMLDKNMKQNKLYKAMARRLKTVNMKLNIAYVCDEQLIVSIIPPEKYGYDLFVDKFASDNIHGKVRLILKNPDKSWYEDANDLKLYTDTVNKHVKVFKWLQEQDFSTLYRFSKKEDPVIEKGEFAFHTRDYSGKVVGEIVKYLEKKYAVETIFGIGYCSEKRIVTITNDFTHMKVKSAPAWYDLNVFDLNGNHLSEKKHIIVGDYYNSFYVENILSDDGEKIELALRSHLNGGYSKCDDTYFAYAAINKDMCVKNVTFVFSRRYSERDYPISKGIRQNGSYSYVVTDDEELTKDEAIAKSKAFTLKMACY